MEIEELTPTIEEMKRVLEGKVDESTLIEELNTYLNIYKVSLEAAKRGILRKYGGDTGFVTAEAVNKKISELEGNEQNVDLLARVVFVEDREIQTKNGPRSITSGILGDDTGTVPFTSWESGKFQLEKGVTYLFKNVYAKTWNEKVQVNMGNRAEVERKDDVELGMPERTISYSSREAKVAELREGMSSVTITGKILSVGPKDITSRGEKKTIFTGILADESGKVEFSAWSDFGLEQDEVIQIKNAYVRAWRGIPQLNIGDRSEVSRVDDDFDQDLDMDGSTVKAIGELVAVGGGLDVTVVGSVVDLRAGSGLIKRCPECNRSVFNDECASHGRITPVQDLRMKAVIDDGSGALTAIINREITEALTGITLDEAVEMARDNLDSDAVSRKMEEMIIGRWVQVRGNVISDEYGLMLISREACMDELDVKSEAEKLLHELEVMM